jgi:hypothetical protein
LAFAFGVLRLRPWEFYRYTAREYGLMMDGFALSEQRDLDNLRWATFVHCQLHGAKKIKKPADLMKLPLVDTEREKATAEAMREFLKRKINLPDG